MLLPALCVLAVAAVGLAAPRHNTEDDYIDQLLQDEMRQEYNNNNLPQRQTREDFGQFHDKDDYEQMAEQSQQQQSSNLEQANGDAEQYDQSNDQQQNGAIEQFDQQQNGAIEQFDQDNDQQQNGAIKFDQNNEQAQNGDIEQFDQDGDQDQSGGIEQFDDDNEDEKTTESDHGVEQLSHNQQGNQVSGRGHGTSGDQDRIHKEAIDSLFGSANGNDFQEDEQFSDVFGKKPGFRDPTVEIPETVPEKKPSWFHRAWSSTKQKAKHIKDKVKGFFG